MYLFFIPISTFRKVFLRSTSSWQSMANVQLHQPHFQVLFRYLWVLSCRNIHNFADDSRILASWSFFIWWQVDWTHGNGWYALSTSADPCCSDPFGCFAYGKMCLRICVFRPSTFGHMCAWICNETDTMTLDIIFCFDFLYLLWFICFFFGGCACFVFLCGGCGWRWRLGCG